MSMSHQPIVASAPLPRFVDCTMSPSCPRGCFPGLPPMKILTAAEALSHIIESAPSIVTTGWISFLAGAVYGVLFSRLFSMRQQILKWLFLGSLLMLFHRQLNKRIPKLKAVSVMQNVSSNERGPCRVVTEALLITNSHAGTHADTPFHFCQNVASPCYKETQYNGKAVVVNMMPFFPAGEGRAITVPLLQAWEAQRGLELNSFERILFKTHDAMVTDTSPWTSDFAFFDPAAARYLTSKGKLVLVGIDTPSIDNPTLSPICEGSHGAFFDASVAILENLILNAVPFQNEVCMGSVLTTFFPSQRFEDSQGCNVRFFLSEE